MGIIRLEVTSAHLQAGFGEGGIGDDPNWRIVLEVKPKWPEQLQLATGEEIGWLAEEGQLAMSLTFKEADEGEVAWTKERTKDLSLEAWESEALAIGRATYLMREGLPSSIILVAYTPKNVLASMVRFAEHGRYITEATVELTGLAYGGRPDGSLKKWPNNDRHGTLPMIGVSYRWPLQQDMQDEVETGGPRTPAGTALLPLLSDILKEIKRGVLVLWGIILLAVILGVSR